MWAPKELIDSWDNTGFQIGNEDKNIKKILLALDLDEKVHMKAISQGYDMIITHHPLIFRPLSSITTSDKETNIIYNLIREDIVVFNAHTNLDRADKGVNDQLANLFNLNNREALAKDLFQGENTYGIVGSIEEVDLALYLKLIKEKLACEYLVVYGPIDRKVNKVALCGGSGSDFIKDAIEARADIYITGDIKYHDAQYAVGGGLTLVDAGHYHTEKIILPVIKDYLEKNIDEDIIIHIWDKPSPEYRLI